MHRSLQSGVRLWVAQQTAQPMGYVEQLYTFVDTRRQNDQGLPVLYVSYLGLVSEANETELSPDARWFDWYDYFPWEDRRDGRRDWIARVILPRLDAWVAQADTAAMRGERRNRVDLLWGLPPCEWSEERTLQRYELLYEAGLVPESGLCHFSNITTQVNTLMIMNRALLLMLLGLSSITAPSTAAIPPA